MTANRPSEGAGPRAPRRLFVYSAGFLRQRRVRRILQLAGYDIRLGMPKKGDAIGVWGQSPYAARGEAMARRTGAPLIRIEDAFLRSVHPGRAGAPPLGLLIDATGVHFDGRKPSDLESLLAQDPLDDSALMSRARAAIALMRYAHLTKYTAFNPHHPVPAPGYVLVVDQVRGDASVRASNGDRARFLEMLTYARENHPGARIVIKSHPETRDGHRPGHYRAEDLSPGIEICDGAVSPWALLDGAIAVYTLSSQMGFEAILAGHKPFVFGMPFYAGWGLTQDDMPIPRRKRKLTAAQLFAGAMLLYPTWYDPYRDRSASIEDVLYGFDAVSRAWREDHAGWVAEGMRLWKRPALQGFYGQYRPVRFAKDAAQAEHFVKSTEKPRMIWANRADSDHPGWRVEDGFLRSRGLGAELVPPQSLVLDDLGIYYDPQHPSRLERLIADSPGLAPGQLARACALRKRIVRDAVSKYNTGGAVPQLPTGHRILVPGQVEDDASILLGTKAIATNRALLETVRATHPGAVVIYKPHPDVLAGLRPGHVENARDWADQVVTDTAMAPLLDVVDEVWTMTSLTGFEALLRGCRVVVLGAPFYAGWGLTRDLGETPDRRDPAGITLDGLVHATLIDYPRYVDPVTGLPCAPELIVRRLARGEIPSPGPVNRALSKLQGALASRAHLWRR